MDLSYVLWDEIGLSYGLWGDIGLFYGHWDDIGPSYLSRDPCPLLGTCCLVGYEEEGNKEDGSCSQEEVSSGPHQVHSLFPRTKRQLYPTVYNSKGRAV